VTTAEIVTPPRPQSGQAHHNPREKAGNRV